MAENLKITKGQPFVLYVPLVILHADGSKEAVNAASLTGILVVVKSVFDEFTPEYNKYDRYLVLSIPNTLKTGDHAVIVTANLASGRQFSLRIKRAFTIVDWDFQSNWRDYLVGDHIELSDQPFIAGEFTTNAEYEALKQQLREQIAAAEQAAAEAIAEKEHYAEAVEHLDGIAKETSVEGIADSIGTPATGQPSTLFEAIAAGGGGGGGGTGDAREATSQSILAAVQDGNVTAIAELLNNAHGLNALQTLISAIPTTAPATPQNVTDAKDAIIAALPSVSGLATEANATVNKQAILDAIAAAETALQGGDQTATLTALKQAVAAIVIPTDYAKQSNVGTSSDQASESGSSLFAVLKAVWNKVVNIYNALTDGTNGLSAIKSAIPSVSGLATETSVKDGNDTAIGLLKDQTNGLAAIKNSAASAATDAAAAKTAAQAITGYAMQGSDPNATNTAIADAIGTPATGQPSTLFAAIAAGGGGGGGGSAEIFAKLQQIVDAHILGFNYDGLIFESGYTPNGVVDVINNSGKLVEIHDSTGHTIYKITSSAYPKLQVYDMPNASSAGTEIFSSNVLREIIITNAQTLGNTPFYNCGALRYLDIQNSRPNYTTLFSNGSTVGAGSSNLIRVKFGAGLTGSTTFYQIATNAYSNVSNSLLTDEEKAEHPTWHNLDMFLYNIREHIVKNLPDRTGQQPYTLTLSQETRNVLDQETEDAFAAKGWSLAPNKSV